MESSFYLPIFLIAGGIIFLIIFFHYVPFFLWLSAKVSGVHISLIQLFLMRIRNVPPYIIVPGMIEAHKAGLKNITRDELEAHYLAGGHVEKVAVYAAHHAVALGLQRLGHGGKGLLAQKLVPINHHGVDALTGRIGDIALCAQIGFGIAPKDLADELGTGSQLHGPAM